MVLPATSTDGLNWEKPELDVIPGTNAVIALSPSYRRDGCLVWLDHQAKPEARFRMFLYSRWSQGHRGLFTLPRIASIEMSAGRLFAVVTVPVFL